MCTFAIFIVSAAVLHLAQVCAAAVPVRGLRSLLLLTAMKELNTKSSVGSNCEVWKFLVRQINWI